MDAPTAKVPFVESIKHFVKNLGNPDSSFRNIVPSVVSEELVTEEHLLAAQRNMARQELVAKIVTTLIGLGISFTFSYFGIRWLANALDPTKQGKKESQKKVFMNVFCSFM